MWHGEGLVLDDYPTDWDDARKKAGLTWEPELLTPFLPQPMERFGYCAADLTPLGCEACGREVGSLHAEGCAMPKFEGSPVDLRDVRGLPDVDGLRLGGETLWVPTKAVAVVRDDDGRDLASVSDQFSLVFHGGRERASMENIIEAFLGASGTLRFETAGSAKEGAVVWALMYLDEPFTLPGDNGETVPFLALLNPHDGTGACKLTYTQTKVVCWNTFQMASAEGDRHGAQIVFRHSGDVGQRIEGAKDAIAALRDESAQYAEFCDDLFKLNVDDAMVAAYLTDFLPSPRENGQPCSDRVHENVERARAMFRSLYSDSLTTEGIRGTGYGLLQASTEYLDHARAYRSRDSYMGRSILRAEPLKAKAVQLIRGLS